MAEQSPLVSMYRGQKGAEYGILQLDQGFRNRLEAMVAAMPPDVRSGVAISSGYRSEQHQQQLWNAAVRKYGSEAAARKWVAKPGRSNHGHGVAADLTMSNAARRWVHANAERFGMHFPMDHEPWHIEPIGVRDGTYKPGAGNPEAYTQVGDEAAPTMDLSLEANLKRFVSMIEGDVFKIRGGAVSSPTNAARQQLAQRGADDGFA